MSNNLVDTSWTPGGGWYSGPSITAGATDNPFPIHRTTNSIDVFYKNSSNRLIDAWWADGAGGWHISGALD